MHRWLMFLLLFCLAIVPMAEASRGITVKLKASERTNAPDAGSVQLYGASYALVIGNNAYNNGWPRLDRAVEDANAVAAVLRRRGFDVTLKTDLDSYALSKALKSFFVVKGADPNARLLLWYAGHGHTLNGEGYLVPTDAPPAVSPAFLISALPMRNFGSLSRLAASKHVLSIFDSCFSGTVFQTRSGAAPAAITRKTTKPVREFLTSGDAGQQVRDDGSFRTYFVRAIEGESRADINGDGYVTGEELGLFMSQAMSALTNAAQTPKFGKLQDIKFDQGDFVFVLPRSKSSRPAASVTSSPDSASSGLAVELAFWDAIADSSDPEDYLAYLEQYPKGRFTRLAKVRARVDKQESEKLAMAQFPHTSFSKKKQGQQQSLAIQPAEAGRRPPHLRPGQTFHDILRGGGNGPEMVVVPAGPYKIGILKKNKKVAEYVARQHRLEGVIKKPFAVGKYEVTFEEYDRFCVATGRKKKRDAGWGRGKHPVVKIVHEEAMAYAQWLSDKTGHHYRLPSEVEWEYVARAGTETEFWWGDALGSEHANSGLSVPGWFPTGAVGGRDQWLHTAPVGSFPANPFGVHDMIGNVWEMVEDCYHSRLKDAPTDGSAWVKGACGNHVMRGGSWGYGATLTKSAGRASVDINVRTFLYVGFRVARDL